MKSERKQTLESNLLADKIEQLAIKLKKAVPAILAVFAVVVVGLLAYGFYTSVQEKESAKGWTALYFADTDMSDLTAISSDFGGTSAGLWISRRREPDRPGAARIRRRRRRRRRAGCRP